MTHEIHAPYDDDLYEDEPDDLAPARGLVHGTVLSVAAAAAVLILVWAIVA
jgi:hypothetical protein